MKKTSLYRARFWTFKTFELLAQGSFDNLHQIPLVGRLYVPHHGFGAWWWWWLHTSLLSTNWAYSPIDCTALKLYIIGICQRPVFSLGGAHMHKITTMWKFELNWSSKLRDITERKKHPCNKKSCVLRCLISRPQILNLRSQNQICWKLLLSQKLCYFRGSRFSKCFIPSTSPHYSLPNEVLCL